MEAARALGGVVQHDNARTTDHLCLPTAYPFLPLPYTITLGCPGLLNSPESSPLHAGSLARKRADHLLLGLGYVWNLDTALELVVHPRGD